MAPFSTLQKAGSPSQPFRVLPSKIGWKPVILEDERPAPRMPPPRPPRPCGAPGGGCCATRLTATTIDQRDASVERAVAS